MNCEECGEREGDVWIEPNHPGAASKLWCSECLAVDRWGSNPPEAVERLKELKENSPSEWTHQAADEILLEFVPDEVEEAYREIPKWHA